MLSCVISCHLHDTLFRWNIVKVGEEIYDQNGRTPTKKNENYCLGYSNRYRPILRDQWKSTHSMDPYTFWNR